MTDLATLGFAIDSRQAVSAAGNLDRMTAAAGRADAGAARLGRSAGRTGQQIEAVDRPVRRATDALQGLERGAAAAVVRMAALGGAALSLGALASAADRYTEMTNSLRVLEGSQSAVNAAMEQLNAIASRTRAPLDATVQLYQRLKMSAGELGASQQQVMRFTENVGLALAQQGGSAAQASGALMQLSQAMAGGTVRAEEFNSMLEGAFPLVLAAARGIDEAGGSVGKLRQLMLDGQISSREFFDAILSQTDSLTAAMAQTVPTISQAMGRLRDSFTVLIGEMDSAIGVSGAVAKGILALADNLDRVAVYAAAAASGWIAYRAAQALANAGAVTLTGSLTLLRGALARTGFGALVVVVGELAFQFMEASRKTEGLGNAFRWLVATGEAAAYDLQAFFLRSINSIIGGFMELTWQVAEGFNTLFQTDSFRGAMLGEVTQGLARSANAATDAAKAAREVAKGLEIVNEQGETVGGVTAPAITNVGTAAGGAAKSVKKLADEAERWRERIQTPAEKYAEQIEEITKLHRAGALSGEEYARAQALIREELTGTKGLMSELADAGWQWAESGVLNIKSLASALGSTLRSAVVNAVRWMAANPIVMPITATVAGVSTSGTGAAGQALGGSLNPLSMLGRFGQQMLGGFTGPLNSGFSAAFQNGIGDLFNGGLSKGWTTFTSGLNANAASTNFATKLGAYAGPALAGVGIGNMLAGGYQLGGLGGTTTSSVGAGIGALTLGPLGGLVGGALGGLANRLFGQKLKDTRIDGTFADYNFEGRSKSIYSGGLFSSGSTKRKGLSSSVEDPLAAAFAEIQTGIVGAAAQLGIDTEAALAGFRHKFDFSTKDMSGDEITARLQDELGKAGEKMAALALAGTGLQKAGETASAALTRVSQNLSGVNAVLDSIGSRFTMVGLTGAQAASNLVDLFGSLDNLNSLASTYYGAFYSEAEQIANTTRQATSALAALGMALPDTRDGFRALVDAQDLMSEAGRRNYATLLGVAGAMDTVFTAAEQAAQQAAQAAEQAAQAGQSAWNRYQQAYYSADRQVGEAINEANDRLAQYGYTTAAFADRAAFMAHQEMLYQTRGAFDATTLSFLEIATYMDTVFSAQESAAASAAAEQEKLASALDDSRSSILRFIADLTGSANSLTTGGQSIAAAWSDFNRLTMAVRGGDTGATSDLTSAADGLLTMLKAGASSQLDYATQAARVTSSLYATAGGAPAASVVTGPASIYSPSESAAGQGEASAAELRALREENRQLLLKIESHLYTMKGLAVKDDKIGLPPQRAAS
ncbi:tape measure protein [Frigidibacter sp. MR17.24]|uniref:tape measure protein n=1 Tax=Frigidibacter sp. MR17.24 TaxID=3127345 RepID=UPI003012AE33